MAKPPEHLSPSGWSLWEQCPRAWASKYVDGIDPPVGWQAEVGTLAHEVLEDVMRVAPVHRTEDAARSFARLLFNNWDRIPGNGPPPTVVRGEITEADFKRRAWHAISGLWALEEPAEVDVVATEREFNWREGDVPMKVIVDRIDRQPKGSFNPGLRVVDYKTGRLPAKKFQAKVKRQIVVGAMAVASNPEHRLEVAQAGSLLYVSADEAIHAPTAREARTETHRAAQETWEDINAACEDGETWEDFEPTTGTLCQWCHLAAECDAGKAYIRKAELGRWRNYYPESPGALAVAALDAA